MTSVSHTFHRPPRVAIPENTFEDEVVLFFEPKSPESVAAARRSHSRIAARTRERSAPVPAAWAATHLRGGPRNPIFPADAVLAALKTTSIPILHIGGDHDIVFPVENWHALNGQLPTVQLLAFPRAGHGPQHQHPEASAQHIATFLRCHGVNSHSGQYLWTGRQFAAAGLAAYALDLRGRGRSDGERFFVEEIGDYVSDLAAALALAKRRHPGAPVFLLGHSAGGVVSSTYVLDNQSELAGFICESFAFQVPAPGFALSAIKALSHIAPRLPVLKLKNEDFSRDPRAVEALNSDPLTAHEIQPAMTVAALVRADERLRREFPRITLPVLIMHGTEDKATVCHGSEFFYETVGSDDKTLKLYRGHYHDLLNDVGKEQVMSDISDWIAARL